MSYLNANDYRNPHEKRALWVGIGIVVVLLLLVSYEKWWLALGLLVGTALYVWVQQGQFIGSCVAVSEHQFPEVFHVAKEAAHRLQMKQPEVFIKHSPEINAFATGFLGRKSVVLHSATVEAMDDDELRHIIGHEFSHIQCGHTNLGVLTSSAGELSVPGVSHVLSFVFLFHSRQAEYTCDRGGLLASRNPKASISALCKVAVGPELFKRMNLDKFMEQHLDIDQNDVARYSESLAGHPYTVKRIRAILAFAESPLYKSLGAT